jgi:hypothetical protein
MTTPSIPAGLQPNVVGGLSYGAPGGVVRSSVGGGFPRYGMEWDGGTQIFRVTILCTSGIQFSIWTAFFLRTVKKGALPFGLPLDSGFGKAEHVGYIVPGTYQVDRTVADCVAIAFDFETESQGLLLDEDAAQTLVDLYELYGEDMLRLFGRLATFANFDTTVLDF